MTLKTSCERYRERNGYCPARVLADKIYRTRENLQYCSLHGMTLNGPKLGRPPKGRTLYDEQKRLERKEAGERNAIVGRFGEAKHRYGLDRVLTRQAETSETTIHLILLVMNLKKCLRDLLYSFFLTVLQRLSFRGIRKIAFEQWPLATTNYERC